MKIRFLEVFGFRALQNVRLASVILTGMFCTIGFFAVESKAQPADQNFLPGAKGADFQEWHRTVTWPDAKGRTVQKTNLAYVELQTGMHYREGNQWLKSVAKIELLPDNTGAMAAKGRHKVIFPAEIKSGLIELQTPEGQWLRSRVWGLSYFDEASGKSVLLTEVKESDGQLVSDNVVNFPDAFTDFLADIRYTYTPAKFEQDVVLRERPPGPEEFGLNPKTTRLQVLTEFVEAPAPTTSAKISGGLPDQTLGFGAMRIGAGTAFSVETTGDTTGSVGVAKSWNNYKSRDFLVEEVLYEKAAEQLQKLPEAKKHKGASLQRRGSGTNVIAGLQKIMPQRYVKTAPQPGPRRMAQASPKPSPGFVLDYIITLTSEPDFTFKGDTTYYVSGPVNLSDTTTIEGGTVVKFANSSSAKITLGDIQALKTHAYNPAFFTSMHDNSVGATISGSSGTPTTLTGVTFLENVLYAKYMNFRFAGTAVGSPVTQNGPGQSSVSEFRHCQFVKCNQAIAMRCQDQLQSSLILRNTLFSECSTPVYYDLTSPPPDGSNDGYLRAMLLAENITADNGQTFWVNNLPEWTYFYSTVRNCLFTRFANPVLTAMQDAAGGFEGSYENENSQEQSNSSWYAPRGAGNYYLESNSGLRDAGTANIDTTLLAELKKKTTFPPEVQYSPVMTDTTLTPQAQRDTDTPDVGYHYEPIDYLISRLVYNATLTLTDGVAVGYFNNGGILLADGSYLISMGTPLNHNYIVYFNMVQEQPLGFGSAPPQYSRALASISSPTTKPEINLRFTTLVAPQGAFRIIEIGLGDYDSNGWEFRDCEFYCHGAMFDYYGGMANRTYRLINNLFEDAYIGLDAEYGSEGTLEVRNNLFRSRSPAGSLVINAWWSGAGSELKDNVFDGVSSYSDVAGGHNAYVNGGYVAYSYFPHPGDLTIPNFTWVAGPLGNYYQAPNSGLMDQGSCTPAQAGLYHYTVKTAANSKEGTDAGQAVDIGYHYVAVNSSDKPIDTDGDNSPDYLEDINGDGLTNPGETPWGTEVSIATTDPDAYEDGHDPGIITITRTAESLAVPLTVLIQMSGSAMEGTDYFPVGTQVTILPNDTSADVFVCPYTDFFPTEGNESVTVTLQNSSDYRITGASSATLNITDGAPPADQVVSVELARANACENSGQAGSFTIWRTGGTLVGPLTVNFQLTGMATEGADYSTVGTQVTIPANASSASVAITPIPDAITEVSESAVLTLQPGSQYTLGSSVAATVNVMDTCAENGSYVYPLMPGTASWINATPEERVASAVIPQSWRNTASSWQLFCSAIGNPYFRSASLGGYDLSATYAATRVGTVPVLSDVDGASDFGVNVIRFMEELNVPSIKTSTCGDSSLCGIDYRIFCYMAGLDASLNTMSQASRQKLFRLAVWDAADFCNSPDTAFLAAPSIRLMYVIYNKPETFRGAFPPGVTLPTLTAEQITQMEGGSLLEELIPEIYSVKTALGLVTRP